MKLDHIITDTVKAFINGCVVEVSKEKLEEIMNKDLSKVEELAEGKTNVQPEKTETVLETTKDKKPKTPKVEK